MDTSAGKPKPIPEILFCDKRRMRHFYAIWFGQLLSIVFTGVTNFALGWWVLESTGVVTDYALIMVISTLPGILLSPFIGVLVDRHNRKTIMILADVAAAVTSLIIAWLYWTDSLQIWHIYLVTAIDSIALAFQMPASLAGLTMLVPKGQLARAVGMNQISFAMSQICAPFIAGLLLVYVDIEGILLIDLLTFLFAAGIMLFVTIPEPDKRDLPEAKPSMLKESKAGWDYIKQRRPLLYLLSYIAMLNLLAGMVIVSTMPLFKGFANETELGMALAMGGIGALCGGVFASFANWPKSNIHAVLGGGLFYCSFILIMGLFPSLWIAGIAHFIWNASLPILANGNQVIWQHKIEPTIQGRVFAMSRLVGQVTVPLGALLVGPMVDHVLQPMMDSTSDMAAFFTTIVGSGEGRGIGLLIVLVCTPPVLITLYAYTVKPLMNIDKLLPDIGEDKKKAG